MVSFIDRALTLSSVALPTNVCFLPLCHLPKWEINVYFYLQRSFNGEISCHYCTVFLLYCEVLNFHFFSDLFQTVV